MDDAEEDAGRGAEGKGEETACEGGGGVGEHGGVGDGLRAQAATGNLYGVRDRRCME